MPVLCPCCNKMVARSTRILHLKQNKGPPRIRAGAITYRKRVLLATNEPSGSSSATHAEPQPTDVEDGWEEPDDHNIIMEDSEMPDVGAAGEAWREGNGCRRRDLVSVLGDEEEGPESVLGGIDAVEETLRGMLRSRIQAHAPEPNTHSDGDDDPPSSEDSDDDLGRQPELTSDEEEEEPVELELGERDENGLLAYEKLSETFERELVEYAADHLSSEDRAVLRAFAFKTRARLTREAFAMLPFAFDGAPDATEDEIGSRAAFLSGFDPEIRDCCPNSCVRYVGPWENITACPYCSEPRFHPSGRARKKSTYIPIIPRILAWFRNQDMAKKMQYRSTFPVSPPRHAVPGPECRRIHALTGNGFPDRCYCPSEVKDVFDGSHYRALCDTHVKIDGRIQPHRFFDGPRDVGLGITTDGLAPFKRRKHTCWPIILYNLGLPPDERFHKDNIICLGVIPGPKKPHDCDSFLWSFVMEMLKLAAGIPAFDVLAGIMFALRAYLILGGGDIPAVTMVVQMKGHNAYCPCRMCDIKGVQIPNSNVKVYYIPLNRATHPAVIANRNTQVAVYDPRNLPLRTHAQFIAQANEVEHARTQTHRNALSKLYGIKAVPILSTLSSLSFPVSFTYDWMHLLYENNIPNLIMLWTGEFKGLDSGTETYEFDREVWEAIGEATAQSGATIPSAYGPRLPNLAEDRNHYTADMWSFWTLYLGPVLLRRKFKHEKYYEHFIKLVELINKCLQFEHTADDIQKIRTGFIEWVEDYERYYFQYDPERLPVCLLTVHGLLHVADGIELLAPVWVNWAFPMERFCGRIQRNITSRRFPYASIDTFVVAEARLSHLGMKFNCAQMLSLKPPPNAAVRGQRLVPSYPTCVLLPPHVAKGRITDNTQLHRIRACLRTRYGGSWQAISRLVSAANVEEYGKVRRLEGGDTMCASSLVPVADDRRDATWVRYEILVDKNAAYRNRPEVFEMRSFFAQVDHIYVVHVPATPATSSVRISEPETLILAEVRTCIPLYANTLGMQYYEKTETPQVIDMNCIQCLVGRVPVPRTAGQQLWAIIDRSGDLARAIYAVEEDGERDG